jgi:ADP-ribose pyrophosphatase YjhB (NUDIX family)
VADSPRSYPTRPIVAAAAVVLDEGRVLLIRRKSPPNAGLWTFPGGAVELAETVRQCAARETLEETGVQVEVTSIVEVVDAVFRDDSGCPLYHYVIVDCLAHPLGGEPRPASDALEVRWIPIEEALGLDLARPTGEVLRKAAQLPEEPRNPRPA